MRRLKHLFFAVIVFFIIPGTTFSQEVKSLYKEGHRLFKMEHYRKALPFLEKVVEMDSTNANALFETGVCYLHRYSKEKALTYLLKSYALDSNVSKYIHYWLGRAYHQNYMFDKAIKEYNLYKEKLGKSDQRRKEVEKYIEQTKTAKKLMANRENVRVLNVGPSVNTIYSEHSPLTSKNDSILYFTSRRNDATGGKEDLDGEYFEDIFLSKKMENGEWSAPEKVKLNTSGHDASVQLFDNDRKLLVYRQSKGGDIYITEKDSATNNWKSPAKFANINTADFEADAYISQDQKTVLFATNHFKKTGDLDIYYITKNEDGSWSKPKELNGKINTSEDDDAPFLSADGNTLYFSSRGHKGMGGFDVFKSTRDSSGKWSNPVNLGYPINTPDDDVYYFFSSNGKRAYISSYREGGYGEKDIYEIASVASATIVVKVVPACTGKQRQPLSYVLKSIQNTTKPVSLSGMMANDKLEANVYSYNTYRLELYRDKDTVLIDSVEIPFADNPSTIIEKEISLACPEEPVKKDSTAGKQYLHKYVFRNITFEEGTAEPTASGIREIQIASEILKNNPNAEVVIKGHSGTDEKQTLSGERASFVLAQLKSKGVTNSLKDTVGQSGGKNLESRSVVLEVKLKEPLKTNFTSNVIASSSIGDSFMLRSIFFETGKSQLSEEAKAELGILTEILKEKDSLNIEIAGFTDTTGSNAVNQRLSEKRARVAYDYLVAKGVSKDKFKVKGYGKKQPIAENDTEMGRKLNRRVDFYIFKK